MKRPLVLVGFCYLLTLAAAVYFGAYISFICAIICLFIFILTLFIPKLKSAKIISITFLTMSLAFGSFYAYNQETVEPVLGLDGKDAVINGTVVELPYKAYDRFYYVIEADVVFPKNMPKNIKIRLSSRSALKAEPYSKVRCKVHMFLPKGGKGYTSQSYYVSKDIIMLAYLYEYENVKVISPEQKPPYYYALNLRSKLLKSVRTMFAPNEANLINSVLFGDKTGLSDEVYSDFSSIGISHLMSVSGLHMVTMAQLLMLLLMFIKLPNKLSAAIAAVGVFCFMAITCFVPSVMRSGIMCLIYLLGIIISRRPDSLNSLNIAAFFICLINPYAPADIGFLLSFSATLGIILISGKISRYLNGKYDKIKEISPLVRGVNGILSTTAGAVLFTLPIVIIVFKNVSLIAPISNLLELVMSTLMMNFGAIAAVINLVSPHSLFALPFAVAAGLLAKYMQCCAHYLAQIPYCSVPASSGFVMIWLAGTIFLFAVTIYIMKTRRIFKVTALLSVIILFTGIFSNQIFQRNVTKVAILDIGTDESIVLTRNGHAAVIGCGGYSSGLIRNYVISQGITKLDYIQPLTLTNKEARNTAELIKRFPVKTLVVQNEFLVDSFLRKEIPNVSCSEVYNLSASSNLWKNAEIHTECSNGKNVVYITVNNVSVLVCPSKTDLSKLPNQWLYSDFIVTDSVLNNSSLTLPVCTVLSMDKEDLQKYAFKLHKMDPIITGGAGNIVLELNDDRTVKIRRE